jgi:hypothetical protein
MMACVCREDRMISTFLFLQSHLNSISATRLHAGTSSSRYDTNKKNEIRVKWMMMRKNLFNADDVISKANKKPFVYVIASHKRD